MTGIVWLASYPKSGNTWLRIFLANLLHPADQPVDINKLPIRDSIASARILFDRISGLPSALLKPEEIQALRSSVFASLAATEQRRLLIKNHDAWIEPENGMAMFAGEHVESAIYISRNPLDVAPSMQNHFNTTIEKVIDLMCRRDASVSRSVDPSTPYFPETYDNWSDHVQGWLDQKAVPVLSLRYEDMLSDPVREFGRVRNFLRIDVEESVFRKAIEFSAFDQLSAQEQSHGFSEANATGAQFFRQGRSGGWQNSLTRDQAERICHCHADMMRRLGYEDSLTAVRLRANWQ